MTTRTLLKKLLKPHSDKDNNLWMEFLENVDNKILWYPSAGVDFWHLYHYNLDGINGIFKANPTIIHTDKYYYECFDQNRPQNINGLDFRITSKIPLLVYHQQSPTPEQEEGLYDFKTPQEYIESWEEKQEQLINQEEGNYIQDGCVYLFNVNITVRNVEITDQKILYFFWDNIKFFRMINHFEMPIYCILTKRDVMDDHIKPTFWQLVSADSNIEYFITDGIMHRGFGFLDRGILKITLNERLYVTMQFLSSRIWDDLKDELCLYKVVYQNS